jgi:hypothetical protein
MAALSAAFALAVILAAGSKPPPAAAPKPDAATAQPKPEAAAAQPGGEKETPAALIRRSLAAYGGERARVRMGCVRAAGKISSPLHPGEGGRYTRVFSRSSRLRLEVAFPGGSPEVRVLNGARAFRYGEPAPPPVTAMLQLQAARLDLPALLAEWEPRVVDQGEVTHEGQTLRVLGLEIASGMRVEAGIDPRTARILYVRCVASAGPREMETFVVYHDFRTVDGVLVPFQEEGWANGDPTGEVELERVEFVDDVPESTFEP